MDQEIDIWIKKEKSDEISTELTTIGQVYAPGVNVKEELEESANQQILEDLKAEKTSPCIKKDPELHVDDCEHNIVEDALGVSWPTDFIKEDPELILELDETENNVATSSRYTSNCTRLIRDSGETCGISLEESVNQGQVHEELEIGTDESTDFTLFGCHTKGFISQEDTSSGNILKYNLRKKEFQKYSCSYCLKSFPSKYKLIMHVFIHIDAVQPPTYICKSCGEVFHSNLSLNEHSKMSECDQDLFYFSNGHKTATLCKGDKNEPRTEQTEKHSSSKATWKSSRKSFNDKCNTRTMENIAEKSDRNANYRIASITSNVKDHVDILSAKRPYKCDVCDKTFTQLCHKKSHLLIHTGERSHKCQICGRRFILLHHLKAHMLIHTGKRPHRCDICGTSFNKLSNLHRHALVHTRKRLYECEICGKSFTQLGSLKRHELIHTGKRPHKCDKCDKSFLQLSSLTRHVLIHTNKKPLKCEMCGKSFSRLDSLKSHVLLHTQKQTLE